MKTPAADLRRPELRLVRHRHARQPYVEEEWFPQVMEPMAKSRREANTIKRGQPITVVIGNPPYKEKAKGRGGWIEAGSGGKMIAPLDGWNAAAPVGRRRAREAPKEPLRLFLALGDLESVRLRSLRCNRPSRQGGGRHRLLHYGRRLP